MPRDGVQLYPMKMTMDIDYGSLGLAAMVTVFELADLLGVTPKVACEMYLRSEAVKANKEEAA